MRLTSGTAIVLLLGLATLVPAADIPSPESPSSENGELAGLRRQVDAMRAARLAQAEAGPSVPGQPAPQLRPEDAYELEGLRQHVEAMRRARAAQAQSDHQLATATVYPPGGAIVESHGKFGFASFQPAPAQPLQPEQPVVPELPSTLSDALGSLNRSTSLASFESPSISQILESRANVGGPAEAATAQQIQTTAAPDLAGALAQTDSVPSLAVQRRSPVALDPHIRGYKLGQIYTQADGVYWSPARLDLDTMLNKIDPGMIQDVVVIPGPYGLRYGPGLAFIDVVRTPTPRYAAGPETHLDTTGMVRTNGGQLYGRETVFGGAQNYGYRFSYGDRKGSDYEAGDGSKIPSSYHNQDIWGEFSYDITPYQRVEFAYQRLDQTDTEYPGMFFDLNYLGTYGFETRVIDEDPTAPWTKLAVEGWYNRTRFVGDTTRKSNPNFPIIPRVEKALELQFPTQGTASLYGLTTGGAYSSGSRATATFGDADASHVNVGADLRYQGQVIREDFDLGWTRLGSSDAEHFYTNMPRAWLLDPGVFAEWSLPVTEIWTVSVGGRVDTVRTTARASDLQLTGQDGAGLPDLTENNILYAFYLTNKFQLDEHWKLTGGFGHGQRSPTLIERYADGLFLGVLQSGLTRVIGAQDLEPERSWQVDLGLAVEHERWRGSVNVFHAWVMDYITYYDDRVTQPLFDSARLLRYMNTPMATLVGFEMTGEYDLNAHLTPFATMAYVQGTDQELDAPLPAISPLESTVGLRLHDANRGRRWGIEVAARMVDNQGRPGALRLGSSGNIATVVEEATPGFAVCNLRGYWNRTEYLSFIAGIDNVFDKTYQEHLDLRITGPEGERYGRESRVLSPGFTPYCGLQWIF